MVVADNMVGILTTFFQFLSLFVKGRLNEGTYLKILDVIAGIFSANLPSGSAQCLALGC